MSDWLRMRFHANNDDYRPVTFPPVGPYWCTGYRADGAYAVVVAYVKTADQVTQYWPEASNIEYIGKGEIEFSSRFPKPEWWNG